MTNTQHTSGPWKAMKNATGGFIIMAADLILAWVPGKTKAQQANAHLIATAPELLEALELWQSAYTNPDLLGQGELSLLRANASDKARAAIAKARGETELAA